MIGLQFNAALGGIFADDGDGAGTVNNEEAKAVRGSRRANGRTVAGIGAGGARGRGRTGVAEDQSAGAVVNEGAAGRSNEMEFPCLNCKK